MNKPIRILGIDPGSRITGFGVIDWHGREPVYVASGCIKTLPNDELAGRIGMIVRGIGDLVAEYRPNQAAVAALVLRDLPVYEYTALQVKQSVVGQGKAAKEQVQHMVVQMLGLSGTPQADAADGLAVAITHALRSQGLARQLGGLSMKNGRLR